MRLGEKSKTDDKKQTFHKKSFPKDYMCYNRKNLWWKINFYSTVLLNNGTYWFSIISRQPWHRSLILDFAIGF